MIVVRVNAGLGNQMFQYAAGLAMSRRIGCDLLLDLRSFDDGHESFKLNRFCVDFAEAGTPEIRRFWPNKNNIIARSRLYFSRIFYGKGRDTVLSEVLGVYDQRLFSHRGGAFLCGYWQSERYFQDFSDEVRLSFALVSPLSSSAQIFADKITSCDAISLHIRRGDYLEEGNKDFFGCMGGDYYRRAMAYVRDRVPAAHFFVFTNDHAWARMTLNDDPMVTFVDFDSGCSDHEEIHLMSLCRHHIIANSSFSWWGAWLNPSCEKIVIAPSQWFLSIEMQDIVPSDWIRL